MAEETSLYERMAALEAHVRNLQERLRDIDASLRETVREFREALERHRDGHRTEAGEAARTRWRWLSAVLGLLTVAGPIATYAATRIWG